MVSQRVRLLRIVRSSRNNAPYTTAWVVNVSLVAGDEMEVRLHLPAKNIRIVRL